MIPQLSTSMSVITHSPSLTVSESIQHFENHRTTTVGTSASPTVWPYLLGRPSFRTSYHWRRLELASAQARLTLRAQATTSETRICPKQEAFYYNDTIANSVKLTDDAHDVWHWQTYIRRCTPLECKTCTCIRAINQRRRTKFGLFHLMDCYSNLSHHKVWNKRTVAPCR